MRRVISSFDWLKSECTLATHTSNPARKSASQSTPPSASMLSSVPCRSVIFGYFDWSLESFARWASILSSVMRCMYRFGAWSVTA